MGRGEALQALSGYKAWMLLHIPQDTTHPQHNDKMTIVPCLAPKVLCQRFKMMNVQC